MWTCQLRSKSPPSQPTGLRGLFLARDSDKALPGWSGRRRRPQGAYPRFTRGQGRRRAREGLRTALSAPCASVINLRPRQGRVVQGQRRSLVTIIAFFSNSAAPDTHTRPPRRAIPSGALRSLDSPAPQAFGPPEQLAWNVRHTKSGKGRFGFFFPAGVSRAASAVAFGARQPLTLYKSSS